MKTRNLTALTQNYHCWLNQFYKPNAHLNKSGQYSPYNLCINWRLANILETGWTSPRLNPYIKISLWRCLHGQYVSKPPWQIRLHSSYISTSTELEHSPRFCCQLLITPLDLNKSLFKSRAYRDMQKDISNQMFYSAVKSPPQMWLFLWECWLVALTQQGMAHNCTHDAPEWVSMCFTALGIKIICSDHILSKIVFWLNRYFLCISSRHYFVYFSHFASINKKSKTVNQ